MRVARIRESFKQGDTYRVWAIGDTHLGAVDADEDLLKQHIEEIKNDPNARIIFMGDVGDLIDWRDKRFHAGMWPERYVDAMHAEGGIPTETVAHALELFSPVRDRKSTRLNSSHSQQSRMPSSA